MGLILTNVVNGLHNWIPLYREWDSTPFWMLTSYFIARWFTKTSEKDLNTKKNHLKYRKRDSANNVIGNRKRGNRRTN